MLAISSENCFIFIFDFQKRDTWCTSATKLLKTTKHICPSQHSIKEKIITCVTLLNGVCYRAGAGVRAGVARVLDVGAVLLSHSTRGTHDEDTANSKSGIVWDRYVFIISTHK